MCFGVDGALIALYGVFLGAGYGHLSGGGRHAILWCERSAGLRLDFE